MTCNGKDDRNFLNSLHYHPSLWYGHSKLYCEEMIKYWSLEKGVDFQILRIGHVYGPGEDGYNKLIPLTMKKVIRNESLKIWGTGNEFRSFIYIDDVVRVIQRSLHSEVTKEPINIVGSQKISVNDLVNKIILLGGLELAVEREKQNLRSRDFIFNNSRMINFFGGEEYSLDRGLQKEWEYMLGKYL